MKHTYIFILIFYACIYNLQAQNFPIGENGTFSLNGKTYVFDRYKYNLSVYNTQNLVANPGRGLQSSYEHPYFNVQGNCREKTAHTHEYLIIQAIKSVFPPARRQELINEYIRLECLLHRPSNKIQEISFIFDKDTQITRQEMYQLETIIKSQHHVLNVEDLWCPNLEYYSTSDDAIHFKDIL